jgi:hypothetical protein
MEEWNGGGRTIVVTADFSRIHGEQKKASIYKITFYSTEISIQKNVVQPSCCDWRWPVPEYAVYA